MKVVTLVVEAPTCPVRLGMPLLGGRLTAAGIGDYFSYAELVETTKELCAALEADRPLLHTERLALTQAARNLLKKLEAR